MPYRKRDDKDRAAATLGLSAYVQGECDRFLSGATVDQREMMKSAEKIRSVYAAWNAVCGGTREGKHVTGLHYVPENDELIVYADAAPWAQELTMLREIIRARMAHEGAKISSIVFKVSHTKHTNDFSSVHAIHQNAVEKKPTRMVHVQMTEDQRRAIRELDDEFDDPKLREAAKKAMKASFEYKVDRKRS